MPSPTTLPYPKQDCSRCGGTGRYSYNSMHGDRCYGCSGTGQQIAGKRAAAIQQEIVERIRRQKEAQAGDIGAGDRLWITDGRIASSIRRGDGGSWIEVEDVVQIIDAHRGGSVSGTLVQDRRAQWGVRAPRVWRTGCVSISLVGGETIRRLATNQVVRRQALGTIRHSDAVRLLAACPKRLRDDYRTELVDAGWNLEETA